MLETQSVGWRRKLGIGFIEWDDGIDVGAMSELKFVEGFTDVDEACCQVAVFDGDGRSINHEEHKAEQENLKEIHVMAETMKRVLGRYNGNRNMILGN